MSGQTAAVVTAAVVALAAATGSAAVPAEGPAASGAPPRPTSRDTLDHLLTANGHPIRVAEDGLHGAGAELLRRAARGSRFFALGEAPHLRASIPPFAGALFDLLREEAGYRYLALEEGPYIGRLVSGAGRAGGRDSVMAVARWRPTAFHLYTVEELELMAAVASTSRAAVDPVWGLNRVYGAWHVLERLAELAPNDRARRAARTLADSARAYEGERFARGVRWHVEVLEEDALGRLAEAFAPEAGSEAARLLEQLRISRRTFAPYHRDDAEPAAFYRSAQERERNMKRLFARRYREARAADETVPRVMVKLGLYHLSRGRKLVGEVPTLGNFLSELAVFEGEESFHLAVVADAPETREIPLAKPFLEAAPAGEAVVLDFRPLHPLVGSGRVEGLTPAVRRLVLDYDAMVVLPDTGPATVDPLRTPNFHLTPGG